MVLHSHIIFEEADFFLVVHRFGIWPACQCEKTGSILLFRYHDPLPSVFFETFAQFVVISVEYFLGQRIVADDVRDIGTKKYLDVGAPSELSMTWTVFFQLSRP